MLVAGITTGNLFAQQTNQGLVPGDKVPEIRFKEMNKDKEDVLLSEQKGKLVILDFWSTRCIPCIRNFPKMDSLQSKFGDKIKIILVNPAFARDDEKKITRVFDTYTKNYGKPIGLSSTIGDTAAYNLFPHTAHPHIVLIDQQGNYKTATLNITEKDIALMVEQKDAQVIFKNDVGAENSQTRLFSPDTTGIIYKSLFTGYLDSVPRVFVKNHLQIPSSPRTKNIRFINWELMHILRHVYKYYEGAASRIVVEGMKKDELIRTSTTIPTNTWATQHSYCYELIAKNLTREEIREQAKADIRKYLGITANVEKRRIPCWVVKMDEVQYKRLLTQAKRIKEPRKLSEMLDTYFGDIDIPVLMDTPYDLPLFKDLVLPEIVFTNPDNAPDALRQFVKEYQLTLVKEDREQEVFVITKVKP